MMNQSTGSTLRCLRPGSRGTMAAIVMLVVAVLGGCSCNERVYVKNDTNEMLHVQIQLPKPKVPWHCGCKCVYETLVGSGGEWASARPGSPEQMDYPFAAYSECAVVRARVGVSGPWARFTLCGPLLENSNSDPVVVNVVTGAHAGLDATATTKSGQSVSVAADTIDE